MIEALPALWIVFVAFFVAGMVKGVAGVGLPMTALGILTFFTDPRSAFAAALVPIFAANIAQLWRAGEIIGAVRRYWRFMLCLIVLVPLVLSLSADASQEVLLLTLGGVVLIFVALNMFDVIPAVPDRHDRVAQVVMGGFAGVLGGVTSLWLPAIVIYLTARRVEKEEFIRASGLLLFAGSIPLTLGYVREGFLSGPVALLSCLLVIPTLAGMRGGEVLRHRLSEGAFRRAVMFVFLLIGLNLVRRGLFG